MFTLGKTFRFEAAHRLIGYPGKCANVHGHSWKGSVVVECNQLDGFGFGMDFANIKAIMSPLVSELDHSLLLNQGDEDLVRLCRLHEWKVCLFTANPTSEVIAKYLFDHWASMVNTPLKGIRLKEVIIEETCTSMCKYTGYETSSETE